MGVAPGNDDVLSPEELHCIRRSEELRNEARAQMRRQAWQTAIERLAESSALLPQSITYELMGECYAALQDRNKAILYFAAATGLGNKQYKPRVELARLLNSLGKPHEDQAVHHLLEALRLNPRYKVARQLLDQWLASNPRMAVMVDAQQREDAE